MNINWYNENNFYFYFHFRKALKAAIVLQPLLGITNVIQMVAPPGKDCFGFGVWSILSNFLSTFQGFFAALFYCFLNGEVS